MEYQVVIVIAVIAGCGVYLLRRWVRYWFGKPTQGCHGCSTCEPPTPTDLTRHSRDHK